MPVRRLARRLLPHRIILDRERRLGEPATPVMYDVSLVKERLTREIVLGRGGNDRGRMRFLDLGAGDASLDYLLRVRCNLTFLPDLESAEIRRRFEELYDYVGLELSTEDPHVISADICDEAFPDLHREIGGSFDVVYSNNVFEHLRRPWIAAANAVWLLKRGGVCITVAPFALRYHESPGDFFRYTHTGLSSLFEDTGQVRTLVAGYDLTGRRNDWQGSGQTLDACPEDHFGAWRENWFVVSVVEKIS